MSETANTETKNRLKSWALWLAVGAMIVWIVKTVGGIDISNEVNDFLNLALPIAVGFGIINNPTAKKSI